MGLLIQPPYTTRRPRDLEVGDERARPLALFYMAASLEKTGHQVELIDFQTGLYSDRDITSRLRDNTSVIFGITALTGLRFEAINVARIIRKLHPGSLIIVGGVHFSKCPIDTLEHIPEIDAVVVGYGEETLVEIANSYDNKNGFAGISGVIYREGDKIINNGERRPPDLDTLPDYSKFSYEEYPEWLLYHPGRIKAMSVFSSRGCPYRCIFCAVGNSQYLVRRSDLVVDEIEHWKEKFGIRAINFYDYNLTVNPSRVKELCLELIKRKVGVQWWCESRVDIPLELLGLMSEAGCRWVSIGVETGSPEVLKKISKGITYEQVINFIDKCKRLGIGITMLFMVSHPDETLKDLNETNTFIKRVSSKVDYFGVGATLVFPGSAIESMARAKGIIPADFSWSLPYESEISTRLTSFPNIPVFLDKLKVSEIEDFMTYVTAGRRHLWKELITLVKMPSRWKIMSFRQNLLRMCRLFGLLKLKFLWWRSPGVRLRKTSHKLHR
jgi:anaerobic magnesium-protoporphyrin IX monomethyl ester cyclase